MVNPMNLRKTIMGAINIRKFGFAWGVTGVILYFSCVVVMVAAGREGTIFLFNSLMHGIDFSYIMRMDMPLGEMLFGMAETFILCWLMGATMASVYNFLLGTRR